MANDQIIVTKSLWQEGLGSFQRYWKIWLNNASIFFFIILVVQAGFIIFTGTMQGDMEALKGQKDPAAMQDFFMAHLTLFVSYFLALVTVLYVQHYVFYTFFLERELPGIKAKPSVGGFFYFLGMLILLLLLMMLVGLVVGIVAGVGAGISKFINVPGAGFIQVVFFVASFALLMFFTVRWYLVMPLAAGGIRRSFKASWAMTEGKVWRLVGNTLMLLLIFLVVALICLIVIGVLGFVVHMTGLMDSSAPSTKMAIAFLNAINTAFWQVLMYGVLSAYGASVCRILYQEKHQADPSFVLESRT